MPWNSPKNVPALRHTKTLGEESVPKLFPTPLVGSYPQPEWLIDRKKSRGAFRRACARRSCGGSRRTISTRRRTMRRFWRSATRSAPGSTSSPTARCGARARHCQGDDRRLPDLESKSLLGRRHAPRPVARRLGDPRRPSSRACGRQIPDGDDDAAALKSHCAPVRPPVPTKSSRRPRQRRGFVPSLWRRRGLCRHGRSIAPRVRPDPGGSGRSKP